ncbi:MAG: hypothetical protein ACI4SS_04715 [Clostridia bacterium]
MRIRSMNPFMPPVRQPARRPSPPPAPAPAPDPVPPPPIIAAPPEQWNGAEQNGLFKKLAELKKDDYILIGIIAVLFFEGCDDYILLAALGYLFVMGIL